jgi:GAF domain-containing protein
MTADRPASQPLPPQGAASGEARSPEVGGELLLELRNTLERAGRLAGEIQSALVQHGDASGGRQGLDAAREDIRELSERLVDSEHQVQRLMNLYVATYQLHGSLEASVVTRAIGDVVTNLLGADSFAIVLKRDLSAEAGCEVAIFEGSDPSVVGLFGSGSYRGGDEMVDSTLLDETTRWGGESDRALAVVPLRVHDRCVGVLAVYSLLRQKRSLGPDDREMLDLLSAHAASALLAARLFSEQDRKLKTLESLVRLAQGR